MKRKRHTEEQIIAILKEHEAGVKTADLCRKHKIERLAGGRQVGFPATIRVDQGTEFVSRDLDLWAYQRGVTLDFSRPGKPTDNAFIEELSTAASEPNV